MQEVFHLHPVPSVLLDLSGRILDANHAARHSPFARASLRNSEAGIPIGVHWSVALVDSVGFDFASWFEDAVASPVGARLTVSPLRPDQLYFTRLSRLEDRILVTVDYIVDLTTVQRAGSAPGGGDFEVLQQRYPFGSVASFDADYTYLSVAGRGWDEVGIDPRTLEGKRFVELWSSETAEHLAELADVALAGYEVSARVAYEGATFEVWAGPLPEMAGKQRGLFLSRDVTEELRSAETQMLLSAAIDVAPIGVSIAEISDDGFPLIYVNSGFTTITGYQAKEALGRDCKFLQGANTADHHRSAIGEALHRRASITLTLLNYRQDGTPFWNRLTLAPLGLRGAAPSHYIGIQEDVSERRADALERDRLERVAEIGTFASEVAHDFNNLLLQVSGWLELLSGSPDSELHDEACEAIANATRRGRSLTADLLARGRRDGDASTSTTSDTSIIPDLLAPLRRKLPADSALRIDPGPRSVVLAISDVRLEQVLLNLVRNAMDAVAEQGVIEVALGPSEHDDHWMITVRDNGPGMPEEVRLRVFERFFSTKGSRGTGLGMSSTHRIVRDVGGVIECHSQVGEGTVFEIHLPTVGAADSAAAEQLLTAQAKDVGRMRVLVVDDVSEVRQLLRRVLERAGAQVDVAEDGEEALSAWDVGRFDAVVSDRDMPRVDGLDLFRSIEVRCKASGAAPPVMILISGDASRPPNCPPTVRHLTKPFDIDDLIDVLQGGKSGPSLT